MQVSKLTPAEQQELIQRLEYRARYQDASSEEQRRLAYRASLESDFGAFVRAAWHVIRPGQELKWSWHYDLISEYLTLVYERRCRRLIINVPPRTLKSVQITVMFPVWVWTKQPAHNFACSSYSGELSTEHSVMRRSIIESDWYKALWGDRIWLADDQNQKTKYKNNHGAQMIATSVGGTATGLGGDTLILDDGMSPKQASSEAERKTACDWFDNTWRSRLNDPATGAHIIVEQRTSQKDVSGHLLSAEKAEWTHLSLPLEATKAERWEFPISGRVVERESGEILQPDRFPPEVVASAKKRSRVFGAQYQQDPAPDGGIIFQRRWWKYYTTRPAKFDSMNQSWDMSFKKTSDSDHVVGQVWGRRGGEHFLIDQVRERMSFTEAKKAVVMMKARYPKTERILIEDKANGPAIIDALQSTISGIVAIQANDSKLSRAEAASADVESGNCYLPGPEETPPQWVADYIEEHAKFDGQPGGEDDQVDATSHYLNWSRTRMNGLLDYYAQQAAKVKAEKAEEQEQEAKKVPMKARVWSEPIRIIGMGLIPEITKEQWPAVAGELMDWIAFVSNDPERSKDAKRALKALVKKFGDIPGVTCDAVEG